MIKITKLSKTYTSKNNTFYALRNIDLSIDRGEIFGIFGESGAGKSTLIRLFNFLEMPTSGEVVIDGINLATLSTQELRKQRQHMGMIFQHFNLLQSRTVFENIALPLELLGKTKTEIQHTVLPLLEWVRLDDRQTFYPHQLSGGQKQRVAIARALATQPQILLCDEPTSALDPLSTFSILNLLKDINHKLGVTVVLITHEMDVLKHICDRAAVLEQGELVEFGTILELFTKPKLPITQQLIQRFLHIELPPAIKRKLQSQADPMKSRLVRFTFIGQDSGEPLISTLVKKFNVIINIIQANIENIQDVTVGFTVCQVSGAPIDVDQALAYVLPTSITAEVLGYV